MALSITQTPAFITLTQSPTIFTTYENGSVITSSSFQYIGELRYWTGSQASRPATANYTLEKFPNESGVGIFDVGRIVNSTIQSVLESNSSSLEWFDFEVYTRYLSGSTFVTSSHVSSSAYGGLDGYQLFGEQIGEQIYNLTPHWPLMTDGPVTQSYLEENGGRQSIFVGGSGTGTPTRIKYSSDEGNVYINVSTTTDSTQAIVTYPIGPEESDFPFVSPEWFSVQAYNVNTPLKTPITFIQDCKKKYDNVRIKWKNRFGAYDYFNFQLVSRQSFSTSTSTYQPQLGSWGGTSLQYQQYETSIQNYTVDAEQRLLVNTDYVSESYNDIFKQLLMSDEIYWIYDESAGDLRPLTITTSNVTFKTGVVDKLIQYQFDFQYGQSYKLIL